MSKGDFSCSDCIYPLNMPDTLDLYTPDIKILFLTASEKHRDVLSKEGYSKDLFLYKPISILDLLREVNNRVYRKN